MSRELHHPRAEAREGLAQLGRREELRHRELVTQLEHHVDHPCGWCPDLEAHASVGHGRSRPVGTVGVVVALGSEAGGHHTGWIDRSGH